MLKTKKFFYDGDQIYESDQDCSASTMAQLVLSDPELSELEEIVIGCWGESYENSIQDLLDAFVEHKDKLEHIKSLFIGDMGFEECEVSWIEQGNYEELLKALVNLKKLTIKGSSGLSFGKIDHPNLEELEIICGGLPGNVMEQIATAHLPKLKKLNLYLGVEEYGFESDPAYIDKLLNSDVVKNLEYLGLGDSEIQDDIVEAIMNLDTLENLKVLDLSNGTLTDKGGAILLENEDKLKSLEKLDLTYHFLSDDMMKAFEDSSINAVLDDQQEADEYDGELWYYPMLTE